MEYHKSLDLLINSWEDLVIECAKGYNNNIFELEYDLLIRKEISEIIDLNKFNKIDERSKNRVSEIDAEFLKLLTFLDNDDSSLFFNRKFILNYGAKPYYESVLENFLIYIVLV